jgi:hypothetical protein
MTKTEMQEKVKEITKVFNLSTEKLNELYIFWLFPIRKIIQSIKIQDKSIVIYLTHGFSFFIAMPILDVYDAKLSSVITMNTEVILDICDYFFTKKSLNAFKVSDYDFIQLLNILPEQSLIKLRDCLNECVSFNSTMMRPLSTAIRIQLNDLIKTTIQIDLDSQYIEQKIEAAENFLTHYKSFVMIERLKG